MKYHDISKGTAPKGKALEGAKKLEVKHPAVRPHPGLYSEDEVHKNLESTPKLHAQYIRQGKERTKGTPEYAEREARGKEYRSNLLKGYQDAAKKRALKKFT